MLKVVSPSKPLHVRLPDLPFILIATFQIPHPTSSRIIDLSIAEITTLLFFGVTTTYLIFVSSFNAKQKLHRGFVRITLYHGERHRLIRGDIRARSSRRPHFGSARLFDRYLASSCGHSPGVFCSGVRRIIGLRHELYSHPHPTSLLLRSHLLHINLSIPVRA